MDWHGLTGDYHVISWPWALLSLLGRMGEAIWRALRLMQYYLNPKWRQHHWKANFLSHPRRRGSQFLDEAAAAVTEIEEK